MSLRVRRWFLVIVLSSFAAAALAAAVPSVRRPLLASAGRILVVDEPVTTADVIVIAVDANGAGVLEAADLVRAGIAPRVGVFTDPPDAVDSEFLKRGVPYEDVAARSIRQLQSLGISSVERLPRVTGTEDEGLALPRWCDANGIKSVVIVTTTDHSRRLRRVLNRSMEGHPATVRVRAARHSMFEPDRWWHSRAGVRTGIVEFQKLLLDVVRHPFS